MELELVNTTRNHGKRIAVLTNLIVVRAELDWETIFALTQTAVLHDCTLAEYLNDELRGENTCLDEQNMAEHCRAGEKMLVKLQVYRLILDAVLYHHERADGKGALGKAARETPLTAQLIHMADAVDVTFSLDTISPEKYAELLARLEHERGTVFSAECVDLFKRAVSYNILSVIAGEYCHTMLREMLPELTNEASSDVLRKIAPFFARITDYKSHFTWRYSLGIAEKAEKMGQFYGYDSELCDKLYIADTLTTSESF